jgi:hypothetical protein
MYRRFRFLPLLVLMAVSAAACSDDDPTGPSLTAPSGVTATAATATSVVISFATVNGAASYIVQRAPGTADFANIGTTQTGEYVDNSVEPGTTYRYRVAASSGSRTSPFSAEATVTTGSSEGTAVITADITANRTLYADTVYTLRGFIHVTNGATLTIQPGTRIEGDYETLGSSLFVMRGAKIMACGTAAAPIVFTSSRPEGQRQPGDWGGLIIVGNARINRGDPTIIEGTGTGAANPQVNYGGGTNDADSSGELCYVRVEFAGYATAADQELSSFTFAAVGSGTKAEYLQAMSGLDDHFEWFGGTVDHRYLVSYESGDDHFDASEGYSGRVQFMIAYQSKVLIPRPGAGNVSSDPQGIENDGCAGANCVNGQSSQPYTIPLFANFTLIGPGEGVVDATSGGYGMVIRRGSGGYYLNGVVARFPKAALSIRDSTTTARVTAGDMLIANILAAENGALLHAGQQPYDTAANSVVTAAGSAASLFTLLPTDPSNAGQFDWSPAPGSPAATGGAAQFPTSAITAKAGTFVVPTAYRGAAAPGGAKWWEGWTIYADN